VSGLIVAGGRDGSPGGAPVGGLSRAGSFVSSARSAMGVLGGEGGADAAPSGGDGVCPAPGGVDARPELSGAAVMRAATCSTR
jgi:hypothetical protein